ncbi:MAG: YicC family protein [Opitutaceae bacterium]|nr:YicC family protein [Opitutaceae bacterium]
MRSMTGYGRGTAARDHWEVTVQLSSVNRKSLEVAVSLPREWQAFEPEIAALVREKAARGRVQVSIDVRGAAAAGGLTWDDAAVAATLERLAVLAAKHDTAFTPTPELLFQLAQANRVESASLAPEAALALIREAMEPALNDFGAMRAREGAALAADLAARAATLASLVEAVSRRAPEVVQNYRENLLQRLRTAGLELDVSDERVLREIALFADRIDISEELTRLRSHLAQFAALDGGAEPVGRKAEFILQEVGREINTVGSKANDIEIARAVIEFKNELERIREQIQNVE